MSGHLKGILLTLGSIVFFSLTAAKVYDRKSLNHLVPNLFCLVVFDETYNRAKLFAGRINLILNDKNTVTESQTINNKHCRYWILVG